MTYVATLSGLPEHLLRDVIQRMGEDPIRGGYMIISDFDEAQTVREYKAISLLAKRFVDVGRYGLLNSLRLSHTNYERELKLLNTQPHYITFVQRVELLASDHWPGLEATLPAFASLCARFAQVLDRFTFNGGEKAFARFVQARTAMVAPALRASAVIISLNDGRWDSTGVELGAADEQMGNRAVISFIRRDLKATQRFRLSVPRLFFAQRPFEAPKLSSLVKLCLDDGIGGSGTAVSLVELANRASTLCELTCRRGGEFFDSISSATAGRLTKLHLADDTHEGLQPIASLAAFHSLVYLKLGWTVITLQLLASISPTVRYLTIDHVHPSTEGFDSYTIIAEGLKQGLMPGLEAILFDVQYQDEIAVHDPEGYMLLTIEIIRAKMAGRARGIRTRSYTGNMNFGGHPDSNLDDDVNITPENFDEMAERIKKYFYKHHRARDDEDE